MLAERDQSSAEPPSSSSSLSVHSLQSKSAPVATPTPTKLQSKVNLINPSPPSNTEVVVQLSSFDPLHIDQYSSNLKTATELNQNQSDSSSTSESFMELHAIHPVIKSFIIGSVSGTCSTVLFQPLDLIKTRLQTPNFRHGGVGVAATAATHPSGLVSVVGHILRHENFLGLWRGITPSLSRCVPGVGLYFASIHGLKQALHIEGEPSAIESVFLGVTGRSFSGVLMIPFTVIKTRFESKVYQYGSIREAWSCIYKKEGVRGLTCGLLPTLLRDAPFSGIYLLMYTSSKKAVGSEWMDSPTFGPYVRFSCGIAAGIGASLVTQPADVIKTKMQLYPDKFQSIRHVVPYVYQKYGIQGYFKGLMPRMIRRSLVAAMSWTVYEQLIKSLGLK